MARSARIRRRRIYLGQPVPPGREAWHQVPLFPQAEEESVETEPGRTAWWYAPTFLQPPYRLFKPECEEAFVSAWDTARSIVDREREEGIEQAVRDELEQEVRDGLEEELARGGTDWAQEQIQRIEDRYGESAHEECYSGDYVDEIRREAYEEAYEEAKEEADPVKEMRTLLFDNLEVRFQAGMKLVKRRKYDQALSAAKSIRGEIERMDNDLVSDSRLLSRMRAALDRAIPRLQKAASQRQERPIFEGGQLGLTKEEHADRGAYWQEEARVKVRNTAIGHQCTYILAQHIDAMERLGHVRGHGRDDAELRETARRNYENLRRTCLRAGSTVQPMIRDTRKKLARALVALSVEGGCRSALRSYRDAVMAVERARCMGAGMAWWDRQVRRRGKTIIDRCRLKAGIAYVAPRGRASFIEPPEGIPEAAREHYERMVEQYRERHG